MYVCYEFLRVYMNVALCMYVVVLCYVFDMLRLCSDLFRYVFMGACVYVMYVMYATQ